MDMAEGPLKRTKPTPPSPGGVDMATIVSSGINGEFRKRAGRKPTGVPGPQLWTTIADCFLK